MGKWLDVNGEAIYGTRKNPLRTRPDWGYITSRRNTLYLIVFDVPPDANLPLRGAINIRNVRMLGDAKELKVKSESDGQTIRVVTEGVKKPFVVAVELEN